MSGNSSALIHQALDRLRLGDRTAIVELVDGAQRRLRALAAKILNEDFPRLKEQGQCNTLELLDALTQRLETALNKVAPNDVDHLWMVARNHIRWHLFDVAEHEPINVPSFDTFQSPVCPDEEEIESADDMVGSVPSRQAVERELKTLLRKLAPDDERLIDLNIIFGLTHREAAERLHLSECVVQKRWQRIICRLHDSLVQKYPALKTDQPIK